MSFRLREGVEAADWLGYRMCSQRRIGRFVCNGNKYLKWFHLIP